MKVLNQLVLIILFSFAILWGSYFAADHYYHSPINIAQAKVVIVPKGASITKVAHDMAEQGVVRFPFVFSRLARYYKKTNPKFGEYAIEPGMSPADILELMQKGQTIIRKIVVPEGKSVVEVLGILQHAERLKILSDKETLPPEGWLMPQTYYYHYGDTDMDIFEEMEKAREASLDAAWAHRAANLPLKSKEEALTLASIVEKETGADGERGLVASVFINRLNKGMKLESDPTAVYGETHGAPLGHIPNGDDVRNNNVYNTYIIPALPPGPICNPGPAAVAAVLNPAQTDYLFFVANGHGGHNFAATNAEHNANVQKLRDYLEHK